MEKWLWKLCSDIAQEMTNGTCTEKLKCEDWEWNLGKTLLYMVSRGRESNEKSRNSHRRRENPDIQGHRSPRRRVCLRAELTISVQFSCSVVSDSLRPHELQHARPPCPSPTPGVYPNPCLLSRWCHPTISSSVVPFSPYPQSFPASGFFQMSHLFTSGGQIIGVSASTSVLPMNSQDWSPLGWTGWMSLQSKGLSRVFSNTTVQKHQFFCTQLSL